MSKRSRPRRYERRTAPITAQRETAARARRWATRAFIVSVIAWPATVALAALIVSAIDAPSFTWGVIGPSRRSDPLLAFVVARDDVMILMTSLLAIPTVLAVIGWAQTRARVKNVGQDAPPPLSAWSTAGLVVTVALVPNVLGSLWLSTTRPDLLILPQAWPMVAALLALFLWDPANLLRARPKRERL